MVLLLVDSVRGEVLSHFLSLCQFCFAELLIENAFVCMIAFLFTAVAVTSLVPGTIIIQSCRLKICLSRATVSMLE